MFKNKRITFAYWVRRTLTKADIQKILFSDEKYFTLNGIFNRQNDTIFAASGDEADEAKVTHEKTKFPGKLMVWLGVCHKGLTKPIIFNKNETLKKENYVENVLPLALS